jgi:hypothetical protein
MVFGSLFSNSPTAQVFLGAPEAEAEATALSRVSLLDVYEDYHHLLPALTGEKFIVVGRKGAGKSAFAEYVVLRSKDEPNIFCQFIKASDSHIERAIQLGHEAGAQVDTESFFRWLIYTNILKLFSENAAVENDSHYELLRQFLKKNAGYINIRDFEIKALIAKSGFNVSVEYFNRFLRATGGRSLEVKSERAPYFKLLPHLEEVLVKALRAPVERKNSNSYALIFDDLDVHFSACNPRSVESLVTLLRACRHVNNEVFGKNGINAKAIILLRDDIEAYLVSRYADTAKLFSSYVSTINWYQEEYATSPQKEQELNLKRFINRRIQYAFRKSGLACDAQDPWDCLVKPDHLYDRSSFKYIVNNTLFRPRDLLLFFKPLEMGKFTYPLSKSDITILVESYSEELTKEIRNELSSFYSDIQIITIFMALAAIARENSTYKSALQTVTSCCKNVEADGLLEYLFDRSIIGTVDSKGWYWFKCRQPAGFSAPLQLDKTHNIVVQYGVRGHVMRRYASA